MSEPQIHDLVVIGGGPAGLSAGIYAARAGLSTVVLERLAPGGQVAITNEVDNYPGVPAIGGSELGIRMSAHAEAVGVVVDFDTATHINVQEDGRFVVETDGGASHVSGALVYAAGTTPRLAGFEGEQLFKGRGVSYCATCDAMFYRGRDVLVVGGGTAACEEALFLARVARGVTMVVRRDALRTTPMLASRVLAADSGVRVLFGTRVIEASGGQSLTHVTLEDVASGERTVVGSQEPLGVFVFVGHDPASELVANLVDLAPDGSIVTDDLMATRTPGLFAAGDVRMTVLRQVVTAASDGAVAATSALTYLQSRRTLA